MAIQNKPALAQINKILADVRFVIRDYPAEDNYKDMPDQLRCELTLRVIAAIEQFAPGGSIYRRNAEHFIKQPELGAAIYLLSEALATLRALRTAYKMGWEK